MRQYRKFKEIIYFERNANSATFKLFGEYFSFLKQNKPLQKEHKIKVDALVVGNELRKGGINLGQLGVKRILITYDKISILLYFDVYISPSGEKIFHMTAKSESASLYDPEYIYNDLLSKAINTSDVKGKYVKMFDGELFWETIDLTKRNFNDIFLPNKISNELRLYKKVYEKQNHLMRYLLVGIPGTGKTESTLVLANELKNMGVTIIKTSICDVFTEKIRLAELLAPSLVILDDIDLVLGSRNKNGFSKHLKSFLDILDGTEKINGNVGLVATTNSVSLLDIAARRPGRFDKTIIFDSLTEDNVKNIIIKSLKSNFNIAKDKVREEFIHPEILTEYKQMGLTGSHIFNITELLYRKHQLLGLNGSLTSSWVLDQIKGEIDIVNKIKKYNIDITDTFTNSGAKVGVMADNDCIEENLMYVDEEEEVCTDKCCSESPTLASEGHAAAQGMAHPRQC